MFELVNLKSGAWHSELAFVLFVSLRFAPRSPVLGSLFPEP